MVTDLNFVGKDNSKNLAKANCSNFQNLDCVRYNTGIMAYNGLYIDK